MEFTLLWIVQQNVRMIVIGRQVRLKVHDVLLHGFRKSGTHSLRGFKYSVSHKFVFRESESIRRIRHHIAVGVMRCRRDVEEGLLWHESVLALAQSFADVAEDFFKAHFNIPTRIMELCLAYVGDPPNVIGLSLRPKLVVHLLARHLLYKVEGFQQRNGILSCSADVVYLA